MLKNFNTDTAEYQERIQIVLRELQSQTDRGAAIVGGAWVEEALLGTLYAAFEPDAKVWERTLGRYGPLSTFSAKIDLIELLKLATKAIARDLNTIRSVRNDFAHDTVHKKTNQQLGFDAQDIKDKCLGMACIGHLKITDPRQAYIRACAMLYADFTSMQDFVSVPHLGTAMAYNEF